MLGSRVIRVLLIAVAACFVHAARAADALDPEVNSDGFNPAAELYQINEAQRQEQIARQLDLNDRLLGASEYGSRYASPFEPWPCVPGDIWGYPVHRSIAQPIGHESVQTGKNRWLYRPLYATVQPRPPAAAARRATAVPGARPTKVELPHPSDPEPEDFVPARAGPLKKLPTGPRAF